MATRINTKFAIIAAVVVLILGVGGVFAAKKFIFKSAAQYAAIAEQALIDGAAAEATGDIEAANALYDRAAKRFNAAHRRDPANTEYVYRSIIANSAYRCDNTTEAQNRLSMIYGARKVAHDSIQATEEDQRQFYAMLLERHRMGLEVENTRPWIGNMYSMADAQLEVDDSDMLARRWRGISGVYLLRNDMPPEERAVPLEDLNAALAESPNDPLLLHHIAVWHINEARRIRNAQGGTSNDTIARLEAQSRDFSTQAYAAAPTDPYTQVNHLDILMRSPLSEDVRDAILAAMTKLGEQLAGDADARAKLYDMELLRVVSWLSAYRQIAVDLESTQGNDLAIAIADALVADAPDHKSNYYTLATARLALQDYAGTIEALEDGLAATRTVGPLDYMLDLKTNVSMLYQLAHTYVTMAADANPDIEQRDALLAKADEVVARYQAAEGADSREQQANLDFLMGRAAFVRGNPQIAIRHLESANRYSLNTDAQTVMLLAKAHDDNGNTGKAIEYYETLLAPGMQPSATLERFRLVRIYTGLGGVENLERANQHISLFLSYNPDNQQARLLKAEIYAAAERFDLAANEVEDLDLEANPQFIGTYANYLSKDGRTDEALALLRDRLGVEANDNAALSVLFALITDPEQQQAELDRLLAGGLNEENASRIRRVIETGGRMSIEDWIAFQNESGTPELEINKALFNTYSRTGNEEKTREILNELIAMAPDDKNVLEWQFAMAVTDKDWDLADSIITRVLALDPSDRPKSAASNGAFMRAQVQTGRLLDEAGEGESPNLREVVRAYTNALEENDTFAPGWVALGRVYILQQDYPRARDAFDRAYRIQRTNLEAAILLARTLRLTGEIDGALDLYRDAVRRQPGNTELMNEYIALESSMGSRPAAVAQREALRNSSPQNSANRRMLALMYAQDGRTDDALAEIDAIIGYEGASRQSAVAKAEIYSLSGEDEQGLAQMQSYLESRGDEIEEADYLAYAEYLLRNDNAEQAEAVFQQAIAIEDPEARTSTRVWGSALVLLRRMDEAAAVYQDLVNSFPDNPTYKTQLATVQLQMSEFDRALSTLNSVPASAEKELLRAQAEMYRTGPEAGLAIVDNALRTYPDSAALSNLRGKLLVQLADTDLQAGETARGRERLQEALAIYTPMVERNASLYDIRIQIAAIQSTLGNTEDAITRLMRVLDEQPDSMSARMGLFNIYIRQARSTPVNDPRRQRAAESALTAITPVIQAQPESVAALRGGGEAAREAGQYRQSASYYERAFNLTQATEDLLERVSALLYDNRPGDVIALLNNPDYATQLRDSLLLRALQARALAGTNRIDEARNLFRNVLGRAESVGELNAITRQLVLSRLRGEAPEIIADVLGDELPVEIEFQLATIEHDAQDWAALIERLGPYEGRPSGNRAFDFRAMMMLAMAYQSIDDDEANLLHSRRIYEQLLADPEYANSMELLNNLAYLLSDRLHGEAYGRQAVTYAQRAVEAIGANAPDLNRAQVLDTLGWAHFRAGNSNEAISVLRQSIEARPFATNNMHLGLVYMSLEGENNQLQAERYLDDARRASNDDAQRAMIQRYLDEIDSR
ncbi:MAG: tetratricopeptide repeat protein [Phycisphaerales bacterium JB063]